MRLFKQLVGVFAVVSVLVAIMLMFTFDVIKIDWPSFMEIQPSYRPMEDPLPVPQRSIPVEGAAYIPNMGAPENPSIVDEASLTRGAVRCSTLLGPSHAPPRSVSQSSLLGILG